MSEPLSTDPYKGVRDFYPADWAVFAAIFSKIRETLALYGYEEYNASPLERAELYEAKTSEEIVNEQTYTFTDRGDRRVTLRPEMTPTVARMVAAKRRELALPLRWFSLPNLFRYERPQRGRLREHYQLNVDLIGVKEARADGEIMVIAHTILSSFGATNDDFVIRVNSRTLLDAACEAVGMTGEAKKAYTRLLDKKAKLTAEDYATALAEITSTDPLSLIESSDERIKTEKDTITNLISAFHARGMTNVVFDPLITRGFDYYTGIVFEIFDTDPANTRSLFGGGRYDNLIGVLGGGESLPAVGFGMGDVTLSDFLATHNLLPSSSSSPQVYIGTPSESDLADANTAAEQLRAQKLRVFVNITDKSLGDQIKDAVKRGIPYFFAYGADEAASGAVKLKKLATSEETSLSFSELAAQITNRD